MSDYYSRWWMNANAEKIGNESDYVKYRDKWNPPAQLLMNGLSGMSEQNIVVRLATSFRARNGKTIYRSYEANQREKRFWVVRTPEQHVQYILDHGAPKWIWFQVGNEPFYEDGKTERDIRAMCKWLAAFIRLCIQYGLRVVVYNPSVGGFEKAWIDAGWYDELLIELARHAHITVDGWPQIILGSHSTAYWMGLAPWHCAGKDPAELIRPTLLTKASRPTRDQIFDADTHDNYILFRDYWFIERTRWLQKEMHINEGIDVKIVATEAGPEDLPNIRQQFPQVASKIDEVCNRQWRGVRTALPYYEWVYPNQTGAEGVCDDMAFIEEMAPDCYLAFLAFTWSWHDDEPDKWRTNYNWGEEIAILNIWPAVLKKVVYPPAVPKPVNAGVAVKSVVKTPDRYINLREGPGTEYKDIGDVVLGQVVFAYPATLANDWLYVELMDAYGLRSDEGGWLCRQGGQVVFEEAKPPTPPPVVNGLSDEARLAIATICEQFAILARLEVSFETAMIVMAQQMRNPR